MRILVPLLSIHDSVFNISAVILKGQSWLSIESPTMTARSFAFAIKIKDYAEGGKTSFMTLKVHTFIGRLIRHIPDKHFPMIRYAGLFSNRWKEHYLSQARIALNRSHPDDSDGNIQSAWAERQAAYAYTGIDPLVCPNCDQPLTFVGTFFGNWNELQCLFDKAGKDPFIASVLLRPG